jgi:hypothetical protein
MVSNEVATVEQRAWSSREHFAFCIERLHCHARRKRTGEHLLTGQRDGTGRSRCLPVAAGPRYLEGVRACRLPIHLRLERPGPGRSRSRQWQ